MAYDIHPLSFSEILDRAFRVYADNFILLMGISAVFWIPVGILRASHGIIGHGSVLAFESVLLLVAEPVMHAALIVAVTSVYLDRPTSISEACESASLIALPFIALNAVYLTMFLLFLVTGVGAFAISAVMFEASPILAAGLLAVVLVVVLGAAAVEVYFLICWSLVGPVMVIDRRFGRAALRRSKELVAASWWRSFGIMVTAVLVAELPYHTMKLVWGFVPVAGAVLSFTTAAVTTTYGVVALMIYYIDRRCRTEDFDLRLLAEQVRVDSRTATAPVRRSSVVV